MAGATSLVQLILKKWGDDIAGAAKELEEKVGFPESVANRIATGELPMDAESVAKRAQDQGYGDVVYRGINGEYDPEKAGHYQMFTTSEQDAAEYGENVIEARLRRGNNAAIDGKGRNFHSVYVGDAPKNLFDNLRLPNRESQSARTDDIAHAAKGVGYDSVTIKNIHDKADNEIPKRPAENATGPSDEEIMRELGLEYNPSPNASPTPDARNYDPVDVDVVFDPSRIRSPNAAFDPQYTGKNIMGFADPKLLAGTAAGTAGLLGLLASEDADASVVTPAIRRILSAVDKADADRITKEIEGGWFLHNTDKFDAPDDPTRFGQHIEPSGQYISPTSGPRNDLPENLVQGQKDFQNPLMLKSSGGYQDPGNWKHQLSEMYGGLTGQDLSDAVRADGYDGIYTLESGPRGSYLSEAVDLSQGKAGSKIERGNATVPMLATTAGLSGAGLLAPMIKDSGMISAPRSETLFDLTMGARDLERRLEGSLGSLLFPSGLVEYLETVNRREEDPNAMTRGMALLDVLPF